MDGEMKANNWKTFFFLSSTFYAFSQLHRVENVLLSSVWNSCIWTRNSDLSYFVIHIFYTQSTILFFYSFFPFFSFLWSANTFFHFFPESIALCFLSIRHFFLLVYTIQRSLKPTKLLVRLENISIGFFFDFSFFRLSTWKFDFSPQTSLKHTLKHKI